MKNAFKILAVLGLILIMPFHAHQSKRSLASSDELRPASERTIKVSGKNGASFSANFQVPSTQTLKIKVTPLPAPNMEVTGYTNDVFPYGCAQLKVTVNGIEPKTTQILRVEGVKQEENSKCFNSPTSEVLDFSDILTNNNSPVTISISNAAYDQCRDESSPLLYGCGMSLLFSNHLMSANISTQTDGTEFK